MLLLFGRTSTLIVLVYVDDILVTGSDQVLIQQLITKLNTAFALRDFGILSYFLGIEVLYDEDFMYLSEHKYISDLLDKTEMLDTKPAKTPGVIGKTLSKYDGVPFDDQTQYRSIVGALQYATLTRPYIAYAVNKACWFMHQPTTEHWLVVKQILRHLRGTMQDGLQLKASSDLHIPAFYGCKLQTQF